MYLDTTPTHRRARGMHGMAATQEQLATISTLYQKELGRAPDPGGLSYWANLVDSGYTPTDVARGIANSPEYQSLQSAPPPTPQVSVPVPVLTPSIVQQPVYTPPMMTTALTAPASITASATGSNNTRILLIAGLAVGAILLLKKKKKKHA